MLPILKHVLLNTGLVRLGLVAWYRFDELTGQILHDYSGYGYNGTLGSTAGSDTNDPTYTGQGQTFTTDDYDALPSSFNPNNNWTVCLVAKRDGTPVASEVAYSIGSSTDANPYVIVYKTSGGALGLQIRGNTPGDIVTITTTWAVGYNSVVVKRKGNTITCKNLSTGGVVSDSSFVGTLTTDQACIGALRRTTISNYLTGEVNYNLIYDKATSDSEDTQINNYLKTKLKERGIILA